MNPELVVEIAKAFIAYCINYIYSILVKSDFTSSICTVACRADGTKLQTWILGKCLGISRRYLVWIFRQPMSTTLPGIFHLELRWPRYLVSKLPIHQSKDVACYERDLRTHAQLVKTKLLTTTRSQERLGTIELTNLTSLLGTQIHKKTSIK